MILMDRGMRTGGIRTGSLLTGNSQRDIWMRVSGIKKETQEDGSSQMKLNVSTRWTGMMMSLTTFADEPSGNVST